MVYAGPWWQRKKYYLHGDIPQDILQSFAATCAVVSEYRMISERAVCIVCTGKKWGK